MSSVRLKRLGMSSAVAAALLCLTIACASSAPRVSQEAQGVQPIRPTPTEVWAGLLERTPYPYLLSLPSANRTDLDGTYTKVEASKAEHVPCMRCPDWGLEGGVWKLSLDRGVFRVLHEDTGWHSIGSFVVATDQSSVEQALRLVLLNDPVCPSALGVYEWQLSDGELTLAVIDDPCFIHLRAENLTHVPWVSCQPPSEEAAVTDHWPKPPGCD